jgi:hypothetical protein
MRIQGKASGSNGRYIFHDSLCSSIWLWQAGIRISNFNAIEDFSPDW